MTSRNSVLKPLPVSFYARPAETVAPELIGKLIVRRLPGQADRVARLVEVEAYLGERDAASHARRGPTPRAAIMFGPPGRLYVYLIYGMHHCMNVVCESKGIAGAVLLRAAEPLRGFDLSEAGRLGARVLSGPGKLCLGMEITRANNGAMLRRAAGFYVADDQSAPPPVASSARVGVDYAGQWAAAPLRFYAQGSTYVSGMRTRPQRS